MGCQCVNRGGAGVPLPAALAEHVAALHSPTMQQLEAGDLGSSPDQAAQQLRLLRESIGQLRAVAQPPESSNRIAAQVRVDQLLLQASKERGEFSRRFVSFLSTLLLGGGGASAPADQVEDDKLDFVTSALLRMLLAAEPGSRLPVTLPPVQSLVPSSLAAHPLSLR